VTVPLDAGTNKENVQAVADPGVPVWVNVFVPVGSEGARR
jgi:hypothetical protein